MDCAPCALTSWREGALERLFASLSITTCPLSATLIRARSVVQVHPGPPFKSHLNTRTFMASVPVCPMCLPHCTLSAIPEYQKAIDLSQGDQDATAAALAHAYAATGKEAAAKKLLHEWLRQSQTKYVSPLWLRPSTLDWETKIKPSSTSKKRTKKDLPIFRTSCAPTRGSTTFAPTHPSRTSCAA